jgi:hypothetical protein
MARLREVADDGAASIAGGPRERGACAAPVHGADRAGARYPGHAEEADRSGQAGRRLEAKVVYVSKDQAAGITKGRGLRRLP